MQGVPLEVEKDNLLLVFQNLKLDGKKMLTENREPFSTMIGYREDPTNWRWRDAFRTFGWNSIISTNFLPKSTKLVIDNGYLFCYH